MGLGPLHARNKEIISVLVLEFFGFLFAKQHLSVFEDERQKVVVDRAHVQSDTSVVRLSCESTRVDTIFDFFIDELLQFFVPKHRLDDQDDLREDPIRVRDAVFLHDVSEKPRLLGLFDELRWVAHVLVLGNLQGLKSVLRLQRSVFFPVAKYFAYLR